MTKVMTSSNKAVAQPPTPCPGCGQPVHAAAIDRFGNYELFACVDCGLQFWNPREMPDAAWYERVYGGRDQKILPLEPGHEYFLSDDLAPGAGDLLDIGCGTGNFLAAAQRAGYRATGIELDRNAARFAKEHLGLGRILPLTISEFAERYPGERFDVITFFEVLEHQAQPTEFLQKVKACLKADGIVALSVPNRERWLTGPDVLDYPPNHFLRWSPKSLRAFLASQGFRVLSMVEEPPTLQYTAQMINMALRTGATKFLEKDPPASFRDLILMSSEDSESALQTKTRTRRPIVEMLRHIKQAACYPLALAMFPYVRARGFKGTYLYCLATLSST